MGGVVRKRLALFSISVAISFLVNSIAPAQAQEDVQGREEYKIGPEDRLDISVWKNQDLSRIVIVRPDGMISIPLLNDVRAAGLTPKELRDTLTQKLTEYLTTPEVSVVVTEVHSFKVAVIGEVVSPGRFEFGNQTTVLDALAQAGGFRDTASRNQIVVLRHEGASVTRMPFDYMKAISEGGEPENFLLQPGDIVVVPEKHGTEDAGDQSSALRES